MDQFERWKIILATSFDQFLSTLGAYLPSLLGAAVLMLSGFIVAALSRWLIIRLFVGMDSVAQKFTLQLSGIQLPWSLIRILAAIAYWLILLFFITAAAESLGLPGIAEWLAQIFVYLPSLIIALFIVWFGFILGTFVRDKIIALASAGELAHAEELSETARMVVITLTIVIGLGQIGIHIQLIEYLLVVIFAAIALALALAFGIGAGPTLTNIIAIGSLKQRYQIGDQIKIEDTEGDIVAFTKTAVIVETGGGQATVPARKFQEKASFLSQTEKDSSAS